MCVCVCIYLMCVYSLQNPIGPLRYNPTEIPNSIESGETYSHANATRNRESAIARYKRKYAADGQPSQVFGGS